MVRENPAVQRATDSLAEHRLADGHGSWMVLRIGACMESIQGGGIQ